MPFTSKQKPKKMRQDSPLTLLSMKKNFDQKNRHSTVKKIGLVLKRQNLRKKKQSFFKKKKKFLSVLKK